MTFLFLSIESKNNNNTLIIKIMYAKNRFSNLEVHHETNPQVRDRKARKKLREIQIIEEKIKNGFDLSNAEYEKLNKKDFYEKIVDPQRFYANTSQRFPTNQEIKKRRQEQREKEEAERREKEKVERRTREEAERLKQREQERKARKEQKHEAQRKRQYEQQRQEEQRRQYEHQRRYEQQRQYEHQRHYEQQRQEEQIKPIICPLKIKILKEYNDLKRVLSSEKKAYRKLVIKYHPDKNNNSIESIKSTQILNEIHGQYKMRTGFC